MKLANKTIDYRVYAEIDNRDRMITNTTDVTLPEIEMKSDTLSGAGILGELDLPSMAQVNAMSFSFSGRSFDKDSAKLAAPIARKFTVRSALEEFDTGKGKSRIVKCKETIIAMTKKFSPGKVAVGESKDVSYEGEVIYFRQERDGVETIEIDKLNNVYKVGGVNYAAAIAEAL